MVDVNIGLEALGMVAGTVIFLSYVFKDMLKLRIVNLIGSCLWLVYGIWLGSFALLFLNIAAIVFHTYHIIKARRKNSEK